MMLVEDFTQMYILISLIQDIIWTILSITVSTDIQKAELSLTINIWNQGNNSSVCVQRCCVATDLDFQRS